MSSWHSDTNSEYKTVERNDPLIKSLKYQRALRKKPQNVGIEGAIIQDAYRFGNDLRQSIVPKTDEIETGLAGSITEYEARLKTLEELRKKTRELIVVFKSQMQGSEQEFDQRIINLVEWCEKDKGTAHLQARFNAAKQELQEHKEKLAVLSSEMKQRADLIPKSILPMKRRYRFPIFAVVIAILAYFIYNIIN